LFLRRAAPPTLFHNVCPEHAYMYSPELAFHATENFYIFDYPPVIKLQFPLPVFRDSDAFYNLYWKYNLSLPFLLLGELGAGSI